MLFVLFLAILKTGRLIEVDRAGLVAGYVGQTALKTQEKIEEAMGGILFIIVILGLGHVLTSIFSVVMHNPYVLDISWAMCYSVNTTADQETILYVSSPFFHPINQAILYKSIAQLNAGKGTRHELIEDVGDA